MNLPLNYYKNVIGERCVEKVYTSNIPLVASRRLNGWLPKLPGSPKCRASRSILQGHQLAFEMADCNISVVSMQN